MPLADFTHSTLPPDLQRRLLAVARDSIGFGLRQGQALAVPLGDFPHELQAHRASFVSLHRQGMLRGCIGSLEARRPLIADVAENAFAAAFRDPRFPPLGQHEVAELEIHLSLLTPPEPLAVRSEADLLQRLRPGQDGLILQEGGRRATFLPAVWDTLPDPGSFVRHLKQKAGLTADYWSATLEVYVYRAEHIP